MEKGRSMKGREVKGEGGKSVSLPMSLKFDGKSNWKAFYAKFSRSWAGLSPFPLPLILLSPLDVSRGFMFPS
jgi:hypothetical protein